MTTLVGLLAALHSIPDLGGDCACRGEHALFESADPDDIDDAIAICSLCPVLDACGRYWQSLPPSQRPSDCVVAGEYRPAPRQRKRSAA